MVWQGINHCVKIATAKMISLHFFLIKKHKYVIINKNSCTHTKKEVIIISCTIKELARACGVSEGTVDRAVNNRSGIKESTKQRILEMAEQLDYRPNHLAKSLATGSTKTIGIVSVDLSNNFFALLVESIEQTAREHGYFINLALSHNDPEKEMEAIRYMAERRVDGIILFPLGQGKKFSDFLKKLNIPIVTIYNRIECDFVHVDVDCRLIMRNVVSYLAGKGYQEMIYIDPHFEAMKSEGINVFSIEQRRTGYLEGIHKEELGDGEILEAMDEQQLVNIAKRKDGKRKVFICRNDTPAIRLMTILRKNNISVPKDVGVIGFDNIAILDNMSPRLTSVDCNIKTTGHEATISLIRMINGENDISDCVVDYSIVEGETL